MSASNPEDQDDQSPQESSDDTSSVESHTSSEPFLKNYMNLDEFLQAKGLNIGLPRRSCIIINTNKQLTGGNGALQINQQSDEGDDRSAASDDMASNSSEESASSNFFVPHSHSLNLVGNNGDNAMSSGSGYASSFSSCGNGSISGYISSSSANSATSAQTGHHSKDKKKSEKSKTHDFSSDSGNGSSVCSSIKMEDSDGRASSPEDPFQGVTMSSEDGSISSLPANPALRRTNNLVRKRLQEKLSQGPVSNQAGNSSSSDDSTSGSAPVFYFDYSSEPAAKKRKRNVYHPGPPVKKSTKIHVPDEKKDAKYWERRQKNNLAAKRSREARRQMEMEIARRAQLLEEENKSLRDQVSNLRGKLDELRDQLTEKEPTDIT